MSKVYVLLADGFEEIEALTPVDVLRRAGVDTVTVSIMGRKSVNGSHGIIVEADKVLGTDITRDRMTDADMLVLPGGGKGTENLAASEDVAEIAKTFDKEEKYLAAICAAPSVYGRLGLLSGKKATCFPGFEKYLTDAEATGDFVVRDGRFITAKGMGASLDFALELVKVLVSEEKAGELASKIQYR
ncbi:MAG: DJ-1/PfpI family protein [Lachnospiraceae bacterium]|nr:DJ-1/PfpI family protein [Lachnospiraceae bacterium]MBP5185131.1 DJ-1/PfpI family protein [Lachnospiraceae bacterium]